MLSDIECLSYKCTIWYYGIEALNIFYTVLLEWYDYCLNRLNKAKIPWSQKISQVNGYWRYLILVNNSGIAEIQYNDVFLSGCPYNEHDGKNATYF